MYRSRAALNIRGVSLLGRIQCGYCRSTAPIFPAACSGSSAPFVQLVHEAGIHEPTIVAWKGHIAGGSATDRVRGFEDWLPTLLELAGLKEATPKDIDGISFAPTLVGQTQPPRPFLYREFPASGGQQSVRIGDWKGIRQGMMPEAGKAKNKAKAQAGAAPNMHVQLYNLRSDPHETTDVSAQHPEIVAQIEKLMREQHTPNPDFPFPALDKG